MDRKRAYGRQLLSPAAAAASTAETSSLQMASLVGSPEFKAWALRNVGRMRVEPLPRVAPEGSDAEEDE